MNVPALPGSLMLGSILLLMSQVSGNYKSTVKSGENLMHDSRETVNMRILQYFQTLCCVNKNGSSIRSPPSSLAQSSQDEIYIVLFSTNFRFYSKINWFGWYIDISRKFIYHNQNINTIFWSLNLIARSSSEEAGTQFFRVLMRRSAVAWRRRS